MKTLLVSALSALALCATTANAQASYIRNPTAGTTVTKGQNIVVQVVRPNSIQGSREVGLAIGLYPCGTSPCPSATYPATVPLGSVLYTGPYNPQLHEIPGNPYQNFTVQVPNQDWFNGKAQLTVTRFHLIGAGPSAVLEQNKVQVNVN